MEQPQQPTSGNDAAAQSARAGGAPQQPPESTKPAVPPTPMGNTNVEQTAEDKVDELTERAHEVAEKLKPVAVAAEDITAQVVALSAKGLDKLSAYLQQRREERQQNQHNPPSE